MSNLNFFSPYRNYLTARWDEISRFHPEEGDSREVNSSDTEDTLLLSSKLIPTAESVFLHWNNPPEICPEIRGRNREEQGELDPRELSRVDARPGASRRRKRNTLESRVTFASVT